MLRVAVIGVGSMGYHHARNYAELPDTRLVAVADTNAEQGRQVAGRFGCLFYHSHQDMLDRERLDAVSLAVPTSQHYRIACDLIDAGVSLLVEKPLAGNVAEAEALVAASRRRGSVLAVGHVERCNPAVQELKQRIDAGQLGNITSVVAKRVGLLPPRVRDANVIVDLAVHDIDIFNYMLGGMPTEVYATAGRAILSDRLDHAELFLKYGETGCFVQVNWITPLKIRTLSVTGDRGYAELDYVTQELNVYRQHLPEGQFNDFGDFVQRFGTPEATRVPLERREPLRLELEAFLRSARGVAPVMVTGDEGVCAMRVAEWAMQHLERNGLPGAGK